MTSGRQGFQQSHAGFSQQSNQQEFMVSSNSKPAYGLYEKVIQIEKWFHEERKNQSALSNSNTPLVIVGPEGSGKTTLLFQWMEFHEAKSEFFTNITEFDLNQRIEMQGDKLRTFFQRWLELADQKKKSKTTDKCKIILVIDGIDKLEAEDFSKDKSENFGSASYLEESPDWLPSCFPLSFRVILTCRPHSKSLRYFKNMKTPFRFINLTQEDERNDTEQIIIQIVESHFNTSVSTAYDSQETFNLQKQEALDQISSFLKDPYKKHVFTNKLYLHTYLNIAYPQTINLTQVSKIKNLIDKSELSDKLSVEDLFKHFLKHYEALIFPKSKFRRICCVMALSKTGLSKLELKECLEVHVSYIELYLKIINFALLEHKGLYRINNESYKRTIMAMYFQEEIYKNEIHSSIVTVLQKTKHFNQNSRIIDEVSYNIYKQGNQWLKLKDLLSNLEVFCQMFKAEDKYILCQFWQKLEQHGFDPVLEYNKTMEAFVLNYFPTANELFVILAQIARFFKELGDLETKWTPEFKHPPLLISQELDCIKLGRELEQVGGMLIEIKSNSAPIQEEEKYNIENPLFMQVYREKQVVQLSKENPLFQICQYYYYKRWVWLQFPWFCMDISSSFQFYLQKTIGYALHLHMNIELERDLVQGSLKILREAKTRKQKSGKHILYQLPYELLAINDISENEEQEQEEKDDSEEEYYEEEANLKLNLEEPRRTGTSPQLSQKSALGFGGNGRSSTRGGKRTFKFDQQQIENKDNPYFQTQSQRSVSTAYHGERSSVNKQGKALFINHREGMQSPLQIQQRENSTDQTRQSVTQMSQRVGGFKQSMGYQTERMSIQGLQQSERKSEYIKAKIKWIETDYALSSLKSKFLPENGVRLVGNKVKSYENKELSHYIQINRELVNEFNRICFEIQQKEKILSNLENCIVEVDYNNKETQAFEKRLNSLQERLQQTRSNYKVSKKEQYRLKHIVNYCFKNKADNHEWIQGLELAVKNMVTLIKHEKESVIKAKNQVSELKKQSKEMGRVIGERKKLQHQTVQAVKDMTQEKKKIKMIREDFEKKQMSILRSQNYYGEQQQHYEYLRRFRETEEDNEIKFENQQVYPRVQSQQNLVQRHKLLNIGKSQRQLASSPSVSPQLRNKSSFFINVNDQEGKIVEDQQSLSSQSNKEQLRLQMEQFQKKSGSRDLEDLKFFLSYIQFKRIKEERELKVRILKEEKALLMKELNVFHNQDIERSNLKYQKDRLINNIQNDIVVQEVQKDIKRDIQGKWNTLLIQIKILLEEMRKKMNLEISQVNYAHDKVEADELIKQLNEIAYISNLQRDWIENCFGTSIFHQVMVQIEQNDQTEIRQMILQNRDKDKFFKYNEEKKFKSQTEKIEIQGEFLSGIQKKIQSERVASGKRSGRNMQQKLGTGKKSTLKNESQGPLHMKQLSTQQSNKVLNKDIEEQTVKIQKFKLDFQSAQQFNQNQSYLNKRMSKVSHEYINIDLKHPHTSRPLYESPYQTSLKTFNLPLQDIEKVLYNDQSNEEDQVKVAFDAMNEFKRQQQDYLEDDNYQFIESQRKIMKQKRSNQKEIGAEEDAVAEIIVQDKRSKSIGGNQNIDKKRKFARSSVDLVKKGLKDNNNENTNREQQDIMPPQIQQEGHQMQKVVSSSQLDEIHSDQHKSKDQQDHKVSLRQRSSSIINLNEKESIDFKRRSAGGLTMEIDKLPQYVQTILNGNHKEVMKKLKELNLKVAKLEGDVIIKKLAAQQEDKKYLQWKEQYKEMRGGGLGGTSKYSQN